MQRCEFLRFNQRELIYEVDKVFEAGIEMSFSRQKHDVLEMRVIYMCIDAEQSFKDDLDDCLKVPRERYTEGTWEDLFIIELIFDPSHEKVDVFTS